MEDNTCHRWLRDPKSYLCICPSSRSQLVLVRKMTKNQKLCCINQTTNWKHDLVERYITRVQGGLLITDFWYLRSLTQKSTYLLNQGFKFDKLDICTRELFHTKFQTIFFLIASIEVFFAKSINLRLVNTLLLYSR